MSADVETQQQESTNGTSKFDVPEIELIIKVSRKVGKVQQQTYIHKYVWKNILCIHTPTGRHCKGVRVALRKFPCSGEGKCSSCRSNKKQNEGKLEKNTNCRFSYCASRAASSSFSHFAVCHRILHTIEVTKIATTPVPFGWILKILEIFL